MNILLINSARTWGGTEKWARMATDVLSEEHKTILVYRREIVGSKFGIPKYRLPLSSHIDLYSLVKLVRIIQKEKIEILIPTKRKDYALVGIAAKLCGIRNILRLGIDRKLTIPLIHKIIYHDLTDGLIVNAEKTRRSLLQTPFMADKDIRVIYNGLDTSLIDSDREPLLPEKPAEFLVSAMGILTKRKGFDFLIRSFARFLSANPSSDAALIIIGKGPKQEELQSLATELGISEKVVFTGFLDKPFAWLKQSDVFALTSTNEGISNALLEAMYLHNAPVSTYAGGSAEAITDGHNGFLLDYGNEQKLAEILTHLYRNPDMRESIATRASERVREQFSLQAMKKGVTAFLEEILSKKS